MKTHLKDEIDKFKKWRDCPPEKRTSAWIGYRRRDSRITSRIPSAATSTRSLRSHLLQWVNLLLETFLIFADVYGIFQASTMSIRNIQLSAQVALRSRDTAKLATFVSSSKNMAKQVSTLSRSDHASVEDVGLLSLMEEIIEATTNVSHILFGGISSSLCSKRYTSGALADFLRFLRNNRFPKATNSGIQEFSRVDMGRRVLNSKTIEYEIEVKWVFGSLQELYKICY